MARGQGLKLRTLGGDELRTAFAKATRCLDRYRDAINALNVFPVPDGDTGTNMLLTMNALNEAACASPDTSAGDVAAAMARGALLGARGNSGVILSQFFQGLARGLQGKDSFGGRDLAQALQQASQAAYKAVSKPVEGTMLTVIREMAQAAQEEASRRSPSRASGPRRDGDLLSVWRAA